MLEAMRSAEKQAQQSRSKKFVLDVQFLFVEKKPESFEYLRRVIKESKFREQLAGTIQMIPGEFVSQVPKILEFIKGRGERSQRVIWFLDQFGYKDVPFPTIRQILEEQQNAEIILTFATDFLIDYLSGDEATQKRLDQIGIQIPSTTITTAKEARDWRRTIQFALHREIQVKSGARFYTPFFIRSSDAKRDFWLIHLSGHHRARDVMVGLHWQESTSFAHYGRAGLRMLGYDPDRDEEWTRQKHLPGFFFDDTARVLSQEELMAQLPERLYVCKDGIPVDAFFASVTNETPATSELIREVLTDLAKEGEITVYSRHGKVRRGGKVNSSDIIKPSMQMRLHFLG